MSTERIDVEALRGHTPGPWSLETVATSIGSCHKIGPFPGGMARREAHACVYADGIRIGIDENIPRAQELASNARLIAAAPALLAEVIERRARDAAVAELVEASRSLIDMYKRPGESSIDHYERIAAAFRRDTGMLAPGKDQPAAAGGAGFQERFDAYDAWFVAKGNRIAAALAALQGSQP